MGSKGHKVTAKIAHNTIIGHFENGGFKYKDLQSFISSVNLKFLFKLNFIEPKSWMILPIFWIYNLFGINMTSRLLMVSYRI